MSAAEAPTEDPVEVAKQVTREFNPADYVRKIKGRGGDKDYLDVSWRVLWFRTENPDGRIETEAHTLTDKIAIFKARVTKNRSVDVETGEVREGGIATGFGSETPGDFGDYIEKAETKALGRALNNLGYGIQFAEVDESVDSSPVNRTPTPINRPPENKAEWTFVDHIRSTIKANNKKAWTELFDMAGSDRILWLQIIQATPSANYLDGISNVLAERDLMNPSLAQALAARHKTLDKNLATGRS
jgi:hypothetical protein